jgi:DNA-binding NarL/FixJ family response regulator
MEARNMRRIVEIDVEIPQEMQTRILIEEFHADMMEPADQAKPTTLVLADAHPIVMEGITALCAARDGVEVIAQCTNGAEAVESVLALNPDVAVLDLHMPVVTALEAARRIRRAGSAARILILAMSRDENVIRELFASGANGYLLKDAPARQLFDAISYVLDGGQYLAPGISREVIEPAGERTGPLALLGNREFEIYSFLVEGKRPQEIARLLKISPKTVDTYRSSIVRKLEVEGTAGLVRFALERNRRPSCQQAVPVDL